MSGCFEREQAPPLKAPASKITVRIVFIEKTCGLRPRPLHRYIAKEGQATMKSLVTSPSDGIQSRLPMPIIAMPRRIVTRNPDAMMMTPGPIARVPIQAHAITPVPRSMGVIGAVADIDRDPARVGSHRGKRSRAKERGQ